MIEFEIDKFMYRGGALTRFYYFEIWMLQICVYTYVYPR